MKKAALFIAITFVLVAPAFAQYSSSDIVGTWETMMEQPLGTGDVLGMSEDIMIHMIIDDVTKYDDEGKSSSKGTFAIRFIEGDTKEDANFLYTQNGTWRLNGETMESAVVSFGGFMPANDKAKEFLASYKEFMDIMDASMRTTEVTTTRILHLDGKEMHMRDEEAGLEYSSRKK